MAIPEFERFVSEELSRIPDAHRAEIKAFLDERAINGVKDTTLLKNVRDLADWSRVLGSRPFREALTQDVKAYIMSRGRDGGRLSTSSVNQRKLTIRNFQRWAHGLTKHHPYPAEVAWLEITREKGSERVLEDIITRDELIQMIEAQHHSHDRALLATLYDSGMRASEFCSLRLRDVVLDEYGAILRLRQGTRGLKTGARHVRIIHATPYLIKWINDHPHKSDPEAPLWLSRSPRNFLGPLTGNALHGKIQDLAARADITKPVFPHLFRHSRATELAKQGNLSETMLRLVMGWTRTSDMPSRYIHLAGKDADEALLRQAGKLTTTPTFKPALSPRICVCSAENPPTADYCERPGCGRPLTVHAAQQHQDELVHRLAKALLENPQLVLNTLDQATQRSTQQNTHPNQPTTLPPNARV